MQAFSLLRIILGSKEAEDLSRTLRRALGSNLRIWAGFGLRKIRHFAEICLSLDYDVPFQRGRAAARSRLLREAASTPDADRF
jgi:hypothetical protein